MIVRNDERVSWDVYDVLDLCPYDGESVEEMLIREAKGMAYAPKTACAEVAFNGRDCTVSLSWLTKE